MALPAKKSRAITVDGESYRWMVRATANELVLTVQHEIGGAIAPIDLEQTEPVQERRPLKLGIPIARSEDHAFSCSNADRNGAIAELAASREDPLSFHP